jgi:hypothetical protein
MTQTYAQLHSETRKMKAEYLKGLCTDDTLKERIRGNVDLMKSIEAGIGAWSRIPNVPDGCYPTPVQVYKAAVIRKFVELKSRVKCLLKRRKMEDPHKCEVVRSLVGSTCFTHDALANLYDTVKERRPNLDSWEVKHACMVISFVAMRKETDLMQECEWYLKFRR